MFGQLVGVITGETVALIVGEGVRVGYTGGPVMVEATGDGCSGVWIKLQPANKRHNVVISFLPFIFTHKIYCYINRLIVEA